VWNNYIWILKRKKKKVNVELEELNALRKRLDTDIAKNKEAEQKFSTDLGLIVNSIVDTKKRVDQILERSLDKKVLNENANEEIDFKTKESQLKEFMKSRDMCSKKIHDLDSHVVKCTSEISALQTVITTINNRLPQAEAEKKIAAKVRNFKEAQRIFSEITELTQSKVDKESELQKIIQQKEQDIKDSEIKKIELENIERELTVLERVVDILKVSRLARQIKNIQTIMEEAMRVEDYEELDFLQAEMDENIFEMSEIKTKHNLTDKDLMTGKEKQSGESETVQEKQDIETTAVAKKETPKQDKSELFSKLKNCQFEITEAEAKLQQAIDANDYDQAGCIDTNIKELKDKVKLIITELKEFSNTYEEEELIRNAEQIIVADAD